MILHSWGCTKKKRSSPHLSPFFPVCFYLTYLTCIWHSCQKYVMYFCTPDFSNILFNIIEVVCWWCHNQLNVIKPQAHSLDTGDQLSFSLLKNVGICWWFFFFFSFKFDCCSFSHDYLMLLKSTFSRCLKTQQNGDKNSTSLILDILCLLCHISLDVKQITDHCLQSVVK